MTTTFRCSISCQCTLINFIATEKGLEDQLLAKVVGVERPELEKQAQELQAAFNQVLLLYLHHCLTSGWK